MDTAYGTDRTTLRPGLRLGRDALSLQLSASDTQMIQAPITARMSVVSNICFAYLCFATFSIACPISRVERI
jgi:hypothetical protein